MIIGPHISVADGYTKAINEALKIGADTMMVFSRNPRGGAAAELKEEDINNARILMELNSFGPILIHAPYTLNLAAAKPEAYRFAKECFAEDMQRMIKIPSDMYVFHPGSKTTLPYEKAIEQIATGLREGMIKDSDTYVLLETMSGKGSEIGKTFEELKDIIDAIGDIEGADHIGVCLDTCHLYCAGYDVVNDIDSVLEQFDKTIGINKIKAVHLNDTMNPYASFKDRHEKIGKGYIGIDGIRNIVNCKYLKDKPFFLETPHENIEEFTDEMNTVRNLVV